MKDHVESPEIDILIEGTRRFDEVVADVPIDQSSRVYMVRVKDGMVDDQGWITVDEARRKNALDRRRHGKSVNRYFNNKDSAGAYINDASSEGEPAGEEMPGGDMAGPPDMGGELPGDPALAGGPQGGGEAPAPLDSFDPSMPPPPAEGELPGTDEFPEPMPGGALDTMGEEPGLPDLGMEGGELDDELGDEEDLFGEGDELGDLLPDEEEEEPFEIEVPRRIRLVPRKESQESFESLVEDNLLEMSNSTAADAWAKGDRLPPSRLVGDRRKAALAFTDTQAYSYALPIAEIDRDAKTAKLHSGQQSGGYRYSATTSSHVNMIRSALQYEDFDIETEDFEHPEGEQWSKPTRGDVGGRLQRYSAVPGKSTRQGTLHRGQHFLPGVFGESQASKEAIKNTAKPGGKIASAVGGKEESMDTKDTKESNEAGVMEALMDGEISAAEAIEEMEEMCPKKAKEKKKDKKDSIPPQFQPGGGAKKKKKKDKKSDE